MRQVLNCGTSVTIARRIILIHWRGMPCGVALEEDGITSSVNTLIKVRAVALVLFLDGLRMRIVADGKAVGAVVAFAPPAVEDAQVQAAVAAGLYAAGAGSFQRTARIVQPHVAAGNHLPRDVNIVVLDENQVPLQFAEFAQVNDVLDVALAFVIARMRLAGEDELDGPLLVLGQLHDVLELLENQRRAFVSGEAAGEADRQRVGIEQLIERDEIALREPLALDAAGGGARTRSVRGAACSATPKVPRRR